MNAKLAISALVVALALSACSKQEETVAPAASSAPAAEAPAAPPAEAPAPAEGATPPAAESSSAPAP